MAEAVFNNSALVWLTAPVGSDESRAAGKLGAVLQRAYGDAWLHDAWLTADVEPSGARLLQEAAQANLRGDPEGALRYLEQATASGWAEPWRLRAGFERVYALHRSLRAPDCLAAASKLRRQLNRYRYPWLQAQIAIEHATCAALSGREGESLRELDQVESDLEHSLFSDLRLRAIGIRADVKTNAGDPWAVWPDAEKTLAKWWTGPFAPNRAHQILFDMSEACEFLDFPNAAYEFARAAVDRISETPNTTTEALGRVHVAALASASGRNQEALEQLRRSEKMFASVPGTAVIDRYQFDAEVAMAKAELVAGAPQAALSRMLASEKVSRSAPTFLDDFGRSAVLGMAYARTGNTGEAEPALREALGKLATRLMSLQNKPDRLASVAESAPVFRALVGLLFGKGDEGGALEVWNSYLNATDTPDLRMAPPTVSGSANWLGYVALDDAYAGWLLKPSGVHWFRVAAPAVQVNRVARGILLAASDPHSSLDDLSRDGAWLYEQLIAPVADRLQAGQPLYLVADGELSETPLAVLRTRDGSYLGDRFDLAVAGRIVELSVEAEAPKTALIVAQPALGPVLNKRFPYLPQSAAEAAMVRSYVGNASVLEGSEASLERLQGWSRMPEIFHFSGHGFSNAGHGALLLATRENDATPALLSAGQIARMNFQGCRLAVLSACLTAAGERSGASNPQSLVRAMLLAGAREVVASRWSVDALATRRLMERFYAGLRRGENAPHALRMAANEARRKPGYLHPYYWAAFQVFR